METIELLSSLTQVGGVSGDEFAASNLAASYISEYAQSVEVDNMGNVIAKISTASYGQKTILLDAHIDRIGFVVTGITDNGFLRIAACGGVDKKVLPAQRVCVMGSQTIYGVITATPPHLQSADDKDKVTQIDDLFIDVGLSKEQVESVVSLGDRAIVLIEDACLLNGRYCSGAVDDRAGVVSIIKAVEMLSKKQLNCGLTVLFSAQEETGERGAKAAATKLYYDEFIAVDVSFAHTPDAKKHKCGEMSKGAMIGVAPTLTNALSKQLVSIAQKKRIPYQLEVMSGDTGTNADQLSVANGGAISGLISIPLRYMHTPTEVIDIADVESVAKLIKEYIVTTGCKNV